MVDDARKAWYDTILITVLRRQRQAHFCEFKVSLVYTVSSWLARAPQEDPISKHKQTITKQQTNNPAAAHALN